MTTNQTIDGVPRDLLERILSGMWYAASRHSLADELRALLDAPAEEQQWINIEAFNRVSLELTELKSAQPQGEPVAWMYRREGGECLGQLVQMESDSLKAMREGMMGPLQRILWPREDCIDWKPLYAEQPAPVAVVLPERADASNGSHDHQGGWNACLDEVTRLNPSL